MIFRYCGNILVSMQSYFRILNGEIAPRVLNCLTISLYPKNDLRLNFGHNEDLRKSPQHMNNKGAKKEEQVYFPLTLTRQKVSESLIRRGGGGQMAHQRKSTRLYFCILSNKKHIKGL